MNKAAISAKDPIAETTIATLEGPGWSGTPSGYCAACTTSSTGAFAAPGVGSVNTNCRAPPGPYPVREKLLPSGALPANAAASITAPSGPYNNTAPSVFFKDNPLSSCRTTRYPPPGTTTSESKTGFVRAATIACAPSAVVVAVPVPSRHPRRAAVALALL